MAGRKITITISKERHALLEDLAKRAKSHKATIAKACFEAGIYTVRERIMIEDLAKRPKSYKAKIAKACVEEMKKKTKEKYLSDFFFKIR